MISIVIPTLNSGKFLDKTLDSIVQQSYKDWEVIVIDSDSEDDTLKTLDEYHKKYGDKIQTFRMDRVGQVKAINYGMSMTRGDILTYINSDDVYEPSCLWLVSSVLYIKEFNWMYGIGKIIDKDGKYLRSIVTNFKSLWWKQSSQRVLTWFDYIVQPTVFWKRSLWEKVGEFNPNYPLCFDYDWLLRASKVAHPYFVEQHLADWRAHKDAISVKNVNAQIDESLKINGQFTDSKIDRLIQKSVALGEKIVYGVMK